MKRIKLNQTDQPELPLETAPGGSNSTLTEADLLNFELSHWRNDFSSDGWVMVENLDGEYCRIARVGGSLSKMVERRAFLAYKRFLSVSERRMDGPDSPLVKIPISDDVKADLQFVREGIQNGTMVINCTRIVPSSEQKYFLPPV